MGGGADRYRIAGLGETQLILFCKVFVKILDSQQFQALARSFCVSCSPYKNSTMKKNDLDKGMHFMSPLINREVASKEKGFTENFEVESESNMVCPGSNLSYAPKDVNIVNYYRFEGMSDPGDSNVLYEIETKDGKKGILITPYGNDCPAHVAAFVAKIPQIEKKHEDVPVAI